MAKRAASNSIAKQLGPPGALHHALHVSAGKKLPVSKLRTLAKKNTVNGRRAALLLRLEHKSP